MKIFITEYIADSGKDYLIDRGYKIYEGTGNTKRSMINDIKDCEGMIIRTNPCDKDVLKAATKLKIIAKHGVGIDNIDLEYCKKNDIKITFTPFANSQAVAEHVFYLMFACSRNANNVYKHFRLGKDFDVRSRCLSVELKGKTVGIFGLGRIGRALASMCNGIKMNIIGYDPYVTSEQVDPYIQLYENKNEVLKEADYICMHLPYNDETKNFIGLKEFLIMKESAFFINASRGGVVSESELVNALKMGIIGGAGIDVFEEEPISKNNPLFEMDNVIVTPHQAGATKEAMEKMSLHAAMGIDEFFLKKPLSWPIST